MRYDRGTDEVRGKSLSRLARSHILVVCTANVCRSPLAEFVMQDTFRRMRGFDLVTVGSVGIRPPRNGRICELVASTLPESPEWTEFTESHHSLRATVTRLNQASLILTASRPNRAAVARIAPGVRTRTFTLREALMLGEGYDRPTGVSGLDGVLAFAEYLNARRGVVAPQVPTGIRKWFAPKGDPLSIVDGHNMGSREHHHTIKQVREVTTAIADLMTAGAPLRAVPARAARHS